MIMNDTQTPSGVVIARRHTRMGYGVSSRQEMLTASVLFIIQSTIDVSPAGEKKQRGGCDDLRGAKSHK